ncbi:hypothetical protein LOZ66_001054 [Ophidiomyces ophidiicola]|nr:hypothetical protein LOZ66_001054 [Ophidiomyces ophidiicola]
MVAIVSPVTEYDAAVALDEGLGQVFHKRMIENPTAIAITDEQGQSLTYEQVHNKAIELACRLAQTEFRRGERVGIVVQHGIWDAVTQVAIIYAGGTCVPLDPLLPDQQIQDRLERLRARRVLVDAANCKRNLPSLTLVPLWELNDEDRADEPSTADCCYPVDTGLSHCTHLIHTSGTTSKPKAVQIIARSILHVAYYAPFEPVRKSDIVSHANNTSFDVALFDIWCPLVHGARIAVLSKTTLLDVPAMAAAIRQLGITIMATTTPLVNLAATTCPTAFATLRVLFTGGEVANLRAIGTILAKGPPKHFINAYGPTECCIYCLAREITVDDVTAGKLSIGYPIGHNVCFVADEEGNPLSDGEDGELLVGGPGVSPGYVNHPDKNAASFIEGMVDPQTGTHYRIYRTGDLVRRRIDGQHDFIGRRDHQVKIRGYRIELSAIDTVLMETGYFSEGVSMRVDSMEDGASSALVAFVVLGESSPPTFKADALTRLRAALPEHMVPHLEVILKMPLNAHAKVDRQRLAEMYHQRREKYLHGLSQHSAKLSTREHLARLWATILATPLPQYTNEDDFFLLGGTSLQASILISRIEQELSTKISLLTLYDHSTLGELASVIDCHRGGFLDTVRNERDLWMADTLLADELQLPVRPVIDWRSETEGRVFLTGGTGFVGVFLLAALLAMPDVHQVGCLVRATDATAGRERLRAALTKYGLWREAFLPKILPLCGILEDPWLGLGENRYHEIAEWASVIFHLGARVNYTQPYSLHRPANILGTVHVARMAVTGRHKGLHYCSSISCFGPTGLLTGAKMVYEDAPLLPHLEALPYDHGYAQSQWVADELLRRLMKRGFPIAVYRPGFITGDRQTGACNPDDFFSRLIRASLDLGCYPNLPNQRKEFVPVDYVVAAMLHISSSVFTLGHSFHLLPRRAMSIDMGEVMELLGQVRGVTMECLPYEAWIERLSASSHASLQPLLPMLAEKVHNGLSRWEIYENMPVYDDTNTTRALETYPGGLRCPCFDRKMMEKYVEYLNR